MQWTTKNMAWLAVIFVTAWLTWYAYSDDETAVAQVKSRSDARPIARPESASIEDAGFYLAPREKSLETVYNLFAGPVKVAQKTVSNANIKLPPSAPVLPFKYLGAVTEENQTKVILDQQGEVLAVKAGDQIGTAYKLVAMNKMANNTTLVFLYLPLNITQTMVVSNAE